MTDLLTRLETEEGSRELDGDIHITLGNPGPEHPTSASFWYSVPSYTTSLDAKLLGENIVRVEWLGYRKVWKAFQQPDSGAIDLSLFIGEAKTEVLARRIAALKAHLKINN